MNIEYHRRLKKNSIQEVVEHLKKYLRNSKEEWNITTMEELLNEISDEKIVVSKKYADGYMEYIGRVEIDCESENEFMVYMYYRENEVKK